MSGLIHKFTDISDSTNLVESLRPFVGKRIKNYTPPRKSIVQNFNNLIESLHNEDFDKIEEYRNNLKMGVQKYNFIDDVLMFYPKNKNLAAKMLNKFYFWLYFIFLLLVGAFLLYMGFL